MVVVVVDDDGVDGVVGVVGVAGVVGGGGGVGVVGCVGGVCVWLLLLLLCVCVCVRVVRGGVVWYAVGVVCCEFIPVEIASHFLCACGEGLVWQPLHVVDDLLVRSPTSPCTS